MRRHSLTGSVLTVLLAALLALAGLPTVALADVTVGETDALAAELEEVPDSFDAQEGTDVAVEDASATGDEPVPGAPDEAKLSADDPGEPEAEDASADDAGDVMEAEDAEGAPATLEPLATSSDLTSSDVWLKQQTSGTCTLTAAAMMLRRAAMLNGSTSWRSITEASLRSSAWVEGVGLKWSFSYAGMSVRLGEFDGSSSEAKLVALLAQHPEGVVIYTYAHSVLLTDYTDGVLYCADPSYGDRRPLTSASNGVRANNITQYWYVSSTVAAPEEEAALVNDGLPHVRYRTHVQNDGWQGWSLDGAVAGTSGRSLRLEAIELTVEGLPESGGITYRTHVQNVGWQGWASDGALSGTSGRSLRLEAIQIKLTGTAAASYDVYYRVHAQNVGWMGWAKNGESAGTATYSYRLEAIQVVLVRKGGQAPSTTLGGMAQADGRPFAQRLVQYRSHVQNVGWQGWSYDGDTAGTSGRSLRLEGVELKLPSAPYEGGIRYRTHIQNLGWEDGWRCDGQTSGTSGRSLRLEAIQVELTGEMAQRYDVYYRVHAQNIGWMGWARNGESAGTAGYAYRLEALQVVLVPKGGDAPGTTDGAFSQR